MGTPVYSSMNLTYACACFGKSSYPALANYQQISRNSGCTYEGLDCRCRRLPALKLLVDNLALLKVPKVGREVVELLPRLVLVRDGNLDGREGIKDVELCVGLLAPWLANPSPTADMTYWSGSTPCSS